MTPVAIIGAVVGLASFGLTLAVVLVQLGRVLQRADQYEKETKEAKEAREKEKSAHDEAVSALRVRCEALANLAQGHAHEIASLKSAHQRAETDTAEHRRQNDATMREILARLGESTERLIRIESHVEHHALGDRPTPAPGVQPFNPRRPTDPGTPRSPR